MTDNEIIKALECCTDESYENCNECPYSTDTLSCERLKLLEDSLELINRQNAEIEGLKKEVSVARDAYISIQDRYEHTKTEAYKEFAERLNEEAQIADCFDSYNMVVGTHFIDNLLKEMVGERRITDNQEAEKALEKMK